MSSAAPTGRSKHVATTVIGLITLLLGVAYAALGGCLSLTGDAIEWNPRPDDPVGWLAPIIEITAALIKTVIGISFLLQGVFGMLAGLGVLWRKQWGRVLAFILAVLTIVWGLLCLSVCNLDAAAKTTLIALGVAQVLYGIVVSVIMLKHGAEFSQSRA